MWVYTLLLVCQPDSQPEPESFNPTARRVRCLRGDPPSPDRIICLPPVPRRRPRRPPRGCHPTSRGRLAGAPRRGHRGARRGDASIASHLLIPGASSISAQPTGASAPHIPPPRRPRHPRIRRHVVTRGDELRVVMPLSLQRAEAPRMRRAAGDISRATRHTRTPEPPQTSPAPPGAATRPSPPPIRPRARESGGGDDGAGGSTSEATTSPVTRSRRRSTRAVCLPARPEVIRASIPTPPRAAGSISRRNESLGVADARAEITSSPRRCTP